MLGWLLDMKFFKSIWAQIDEYSWGSGRGAVPPALRVMTAPSNFLAGSEAHLYTG